MTISYLFIDGFLPQAPIYYPDDQTWQRCNKIMIAWLINNLDHYIAKSIMYFKTARDIWVDLEG